MIEKWQERKDMLFPILNKEGGTQNEKMRKELLNILKLKKTQWNGVRKKLSKRNQN